MIDDTEEQKRDAIMLRNEAQTLLELWLSILWAWYITRITLRAWWHRKGWRAMRWAFMDDVAPWTALRHVWLPDMEWIVTASHVFDYGWFLDHSAETLKCAIVAREHYDAGREKQATYWIERVNDCAERDVKRWNEQHGAEVVADRMVEATMRHTDRAAAASMRKHGASYAEIGDRITAERGNRRQRRAARATQPTNVTRKRGEA